MNQIPDVYQVTKHLAYKHGKNKNAKFVYVRIKDNKKLYNLGSYENRFNKRSYASTILWLQPYTEHRAFHEIFFTLSMKYYKGNYHTKFLRNGKVMKNTVKNDRLYCKIVEFIKMMMGTVEKVKRKRILTGDFTVMIDAIGNLRLCEVENIRSCHPTLCLEHKIRTPRDILELPPFVDNSAGFLQKTGNNRSSAGMYEQTDVKLQDYLQFDNKTLMHNGQLRNTKSNLNSPIKILSPAGTEDEDFMDELVDIEELTESDLEQSELDHTPLIQKQFSKIIESKERSQSPERDLSPMRTGNSISNFEQMLISGRMNMSKSKQKTPKAKNTTPTPANAEDLFNDNFKEMLYETIKREKKYEKIRERKKQPMRQNQVRRMSRVQSIVVRGDLQNLFNKSNQSTPKTTPRSKSRFDQMFRKNSISIEEKSALENIMFQTKQSTPHSDCKEDNTAVQLNQLLLPPHLSPHKAINVIPRSLQKDNAIDINDLIIENDEDQGLQNSGRKSMKRSQKSEKQKFMKICNDRQKHIMEKYGDKAMSISSRHAESETSLGQLGRNKPTYRSYSNATWFKTPKRILEGYASLKFIPRKKSPSFRSDKTVPVLPPISK